MTKILISKIVKLKNYLRFIKYIKKIILKKNHRLLMINMRRNLLIASLIVLILGFVIGDMLGNILLTVGILLLLYILFSKETPEETATGYVDTDYLRDKSPLSERESKYVSEPKKTEPKKAKYVAEPKRYKNADRAERELKAWRSDNKGKKCPFCGSTANPADAKFCADCGKKI